MQFSVDLGTFLGEIASKLFDSTEISLDSVFKDLQDLLGRIAAYGPNITAGDTPTELEGLFDIINDQKHFADGLVEFIAFVHNGETIRG